LARRDTTQTMAGGYGRERVVHVPVIFEDDALDLDAVLRDYRGVHAAQQADDLPEEPGRRE
jgi:hypothetical protein